MSCMLEITRYKKYPLNNKPSAGSNFECSNVQFLTKPGLSNINFKTIENYARHGRKFTKIFGENNVVNVPFVKDLWIKPIYG